MRMKWCNGVLEPVGISAFKHLQDTLDDGKIYDVDVRTDRSIKSHSHFFASLNEAFLNLPEAHRLDIPTVEHLRKRAMIHTGWAHSYRIPCASGRAVSDLSKLLRETDAYVVCVPMKDNVLAVYKARSMSMRDMKKAEFQKCKDDVLAWAWDLVGTAPPDKKTLAHA